MASLRSLVLSMKLDQASIARDLKKSQKQFNRFANKVKKDLGPISKGFNLIRKSALSLAPALAGLFAGQSLATQVRFANELGKTAAQLGGTVEFLSEATFAANRFNVSNTQLATGLQRMARRLSEAAVGTGEAQKAIKELGLDAKELEGLTLDEKFTTILNSLGGVEDQATRVRLAMKFFDSEGVKIARLAGSFDELREEGRKLGATVSQDMANSAADAADAFTNLDTAIDSLTREVLPVFADAATTVINRLLDIEIAANRLSFDKLLKEQRAVDEEVKRLEASVAQTSRQISSNGGTVATLSGPGFDSAFASNEDLIKRIKKQAKELAAAYNRQREIDEEEARRVSTGQLRPTGGIDLSPRTSLNAPDEAAELDRITAARSRAREQIEQYNASLLEGAAAINRQFEDERAKLQQLAKDFPEFAKAANNTITALREKADEDIRGLKKTATEVTETMSQFAIQASRNMQNALADFLFDPFEDGLRGMLQSFVNTLRQMVAQAAANQIFKGLSNTFAETAVGAFFGLGKKAYGGPVSSGKPYMVGERGPELFIPGATGTVIPNNKMQGGGVTFVNNITAPSGFDRSAMEAMLNRRDETNKKQFIDMMQRGLVPR